MAEYDRIQKKQESRAFANNETRTKGLLNKHSIVQLLKNENAFKIKKCNNSTSLIQRNNGKRGKVGRFLKKKILSNQNYMELLISDPNSYLNEEILKYYLNEGRKAAGKNQNKIDKIDRFENELIEIKKQSTKQLYQYVMKNFPIKLTGACGDLANFLVTEENLSQEEQGELIVENNPSIDILEARLKNKRNYLFKVDITGHSFTLINYGGSVEIIQGWMGGYSLFDWLKQKTFWTTTDFLVRLRKALGGFDIERNELFKATSVREPVGVEAKMNSKILLESIAYRSKQGIKSGTIVNNIRKKIEKREEEWLLN